MAKKKKGEDAENVEETDLVEGEEDGKKKKKKKKDKKDKNAPEEEGEDGGKKKKKKGGKKKFLLILLIAAGVGAYLNWDTIRPTLYDLTSSVPAVSKYFAEPDADPYTLMTQNQLIEEIKALESAKSSLNIQIETLQKDKTDLSSQISRLRQYETSYNTFQAEKQAWNAEIANSNPSMYINYYEEMYPDDAAQIYAQLKGAVVLNDEQKAYVNMITNMDTKQVASVMELLLETDIPLVKGILEKLTVAKKAELLDEVSVDNAAQLIMLLSPDDF
ncbi:MAG: hypothetical protein ATN36_00210 [Epulopiscium sp. Nele67-Bin005]|nr:MAG: hypothetical protein ATN36_00210 [Epulopiscium sp. Nele67-Bin005]